MPGGPDCARKRLEDIPAQHGYTEITPHDTTEPSGLTPSGLQLTG